MITEKDMDGSFGKMALCTLANGETGVGTGKVSL